MQQAVRSGKWKYIKTEKAPNSQLQITETPKGEFLFDLEKDPGEATNLLDQQPELVQTLKTKLAIWQGNMKVAQSH